MRRAAPVAVAAAMLLAAGCGAGAEPPAPPPPAPEPAAPALAAETLPGMHAETRTLDAPGLALATPLPGLRERLGAWGMRRATEREFTGGGRALDHVVARTVDFAEPAGAAAYQRALVDGSAHYLGAGAQAARLSAGWLIRAPSCGCRPRPPTLIAIVRRRGRVGWLSISGEAATPARAQKLVGQLPLGTKQPL